MMFAINLYRFPENENSERKKSTLKVLPLKHIYSYKNSAMSFPVFRSMYDELSPSYLDGAKASVLASEIGQLMREFSGDEAILTELMQVEQIAHACASGAGHPRIEFTPYGEYSCSNQVKSA